MKLKALRNFSGPEGKFAIGQIFEAKADRAKWLVAEGFAAEDAPPAAPAPPPVKAPAKRAK
ncbi:hypothetical protein [Xenophilus sp. Marseille-Q4582]|uniref:hypothetical protein n=1 Tax=Xenophilus sp. Marseille-Q4582 TaxID=2866600 RepID=UPI001CE47289|nr:hypothetical protein [Xenophilus sp. Marseille-Q4582]